jgi:1,4-alpha-glucan branching enzyme
LRAEYPEWGTKAFDLGKKEVSNFLIASAFFWVNVYHVDALRVDAVAAMLYNSFGREQWRPNMYGGNENLESFEFFRHLNSVLRNRTNAFLIAEDSSIIDGITKPASKGGFGFGLKWNMGWMNDTITYINKDPIYRPYHHWLMTHTFEYIFNENYMLVLSHDEVVYGKGSMFNKFPGNKMDKCGSLKTLYTMMMGHPGKKLLFMGQDFGQEREWNFKDSLDWFLADNDEGHRDIMNCYRTLLHIYTSHPVLYNDCSGPKSFEWINSGDFNRNIFTFIRRNPWNYNDALIFVCNFAPVFRKDMGVGAPLDGVYKRIFTTYPDGSPLEIEATHELCDGREYKLKFDLRPFEAAIFEVPFHESTPEEVKLEQAAKRAAKRQHTLAKNDTAHIPQVDGAPEPKKRTIARAVKTTKAGDTAKTAKATKEAKSTDTTNKAK